MPFLATLVRGDEEVRLQRITQTCCEMLGMYKISCVLGYNKTKTIPKIEEFFHEPVCVKLCVEVVFDKSQVA